MTGGRWCVVCLIVVMLAAAVTGCASIDPTEQAFAITFKNDLSQPVTLIACGNSACRQGTGRWTLPAGKVATDNISDRDYLARWKVLTAAKGKVIGCLPLAFNAKFDGVVVRLSQAVRCPGERPLPLAEISHGKRLGGET